LFQEIGGQPALAIDSLDWEWRKHPVVRIDLAGGDFTVGVERLNAMLASELRREAKRIGVKLARADVDSQFKDLLEKACEATGEDVVVIIDEYDKPLVDTIDMKPIHERLRAALRGFYGVLKSYEDCLRFVFFTGITKFSHVSVFSVLNHLDDLSFDPCYADICGLTQNELEEYFQTEIAAVAKRRQKTKEQYVAELRRFYNGYRFSELPTTLYNPFGLLLHFRRNGKFSSYWYESGSPDFLIRLIRKQAINVSKLGSMRIDESSFYGFDADNMEAVPVLYQTGYLTVKDYDDAAEEYELGFPNVEVATAFSKSLLEQYLSVPIDDGKDFIRKLRNAFSQGDPGTARDVIRAFLASIDYSIAHPTEEYFQTVIFIVFKVLGFDCRVEMCTSKGRIDVLLETQEFVYCFEFKLDKSADAGLAQIDKKEYTLQWTVGSKTVYKVGVGFSSADRNIAEWKHVLA